MLCHRAIVRSSFGHLCKKFHIGASCTAHATGLEGIAANVVCKEQSYLCFDVVHLDRVCHNSLACSLLLLPDLQPVQPQLSARHEQCMASPMLSQAVEAEGKSLDVGTRGLCSLQAAPVNKAIYSATFRHQLRLAARACCRRALFEDSVHRSIALTAKRGSLCRRAHVSLAEAGVSSE